MTSRRKKHFARHLQTENKFIFPMFPMLVFFVLIPEMIKWDSLFQNGTASTSVAACWQTAVNYF
jgi:hypothetical protein